MPDPNASDFPAGLLGNLVIPIKDPCTVILGVLYNFMQISLSPILKDRTLSAERFFLIA